MGKYIISCCSTADLSEEHFKERNISYICFHFELDGKEYQDDLGKSIPFDKFYQAMQDGAETKTSQINADEFEQYFESFLEDEKNTDSIEEIEKFIEQYDNREGLKIVMIEMNNMEMMTFDDVKKIIHNAHIFDYMRYLVNDGHKVLTVSDVNKTSIDWLVNHMISDKK